MTPDYSFFKIIKLFLGGYGLFHFCSISFSLVQITAAKSIFSRNLICKKQVRSTVGQLTCSCDSYRLYYRDKTGQEEANSSLRGKILG